MKKTLFLFLTILFVSQTLLGQGLFPRNKTTNSGGGSQLECFCYEPGEPFELILYTTDLIPSSILNSLHSNNPNMPILNIQNNGIHNHGSCTIYEYIVTYRLEAVNPTDCDPECYDNWGFYISYMSFDFGLFVGNQCLIDYSNSQGLNLFDLECLEVWVNKNYPLFDPADYDCSNGGMKSFDIEVCCYPPPPSIINGGNDINLSALNELEKTSGQVFVYPNPSIDIITVQNADAVLDITNIKGQSVFKPSLEINGLESIDISKFNSGMYIIQVLKNNKIETVKFFKS